MIFHIFLQKYIFFEKGKKKMKNPQEKFLRGEYNRGIGSCYSLIEWKEEEIGGYPFTGNTLGSSDAGARAVTHGAVTFNLTDAGAGTVAHGSVAVDLTDAGAGTVADGAVTVDFSDA